MTNQAKSLDILNPILYWASSIGIAIMGSRSDRHFPPPKSLGM